MKGFCFKKFKNEKNWQDAVKACQNLNSYLIEPRTEEINYIAKTEVSKSWLGASRVGDEWFWHTDSETLTFTDFGDHEDENKTCLAVSNNKYWRDRPCTNRRPFICQTQKRESFIHVQGVPEVLTDFKV